jgi:hypothetical protein
MQDDHGLASKSAGTASLFQQFRQIRLLPRLQRRYIKINPLRVA